MFISPPLLRYQIHFQLTLVILAISKSIHIHINICITIDYEKNKCPHVPINKPLPVLSAQGYFSK